MFFGGPSLSIPGQDWGRDFMGEANTIVGQLSVTHLLYTVQDLFCAARQPRFQNSFHTPLFVFWWTKSNSIPDQDWGRDCMHEADSFVAQLLVTHLLYTVQDLFSTVRQSSFQNSFHIDFRISDYSYKFKQSTQRQAVGQLIQLLGRKRWDMVN